MNTHERMTRQIEQLRRVRDSIHDSAERDRLTTLIRKMVEDRKNLPPFDWND